MKTWAAFILIFILVVVMAPAFAGKPDSGAGVPKYDRATEATFRGTVEEVKDRICPVSGGSTREMSLKSQAQR